MAPLHFFALSDRGVSATNNDAFCAEKIGKYHVFGIAEGLSDPADGGFAGDIAISSLRQSVQAQGDSPAAAIIAALHESDARISAHATTSPGRSMNGTYLSACLIDDALDCTLLDTGEGYACLITPDGVFAPRDYPLSGRPDGLGVLLGDPGEERKRTNMISHTLGEPRILMESEFVAVNMRDIFLLLSSGGLHDLVGKERIAEIVHENGENVEASCEHLMQEALSAGSEQTITLILVCGHPK
ncbi:PP2C family protein-serine/threonine phosphatase [Methanoregula sp.]|uniref:PP2C family protein-serine/threonine phosphatase n=1 Tax=Methanoregula sp. TaxID=2052170 RepID=UPI003BB08E83